MRFYGITSPLGSSVETYLVDDYLIKKTLSRIGYRYSMDHLSDWEVEYLGICESQFTDLEAKERERQAKRK